MRLGAHKAPLAPPAIHAAQHERVGRAGGSASAAGSTAGRPCVRTSQRRGHLTQSRAQDSAPNAAAPQWEPCKPLAGTRKPRRGVDSSGASCAMFGPYWATREPQPLRSVTQANSAQESPAGKVRLQRGYSLLTNNWGLARHGPPVSFDPQTESRKRFCSRRTRPLSISARSSAIPLARQ